MIGYRALPASEVHKETGTVWGDGTEEEERSGSQRYL